MTGGAHARPRRPLRLVGETVLWTGALLGALCILGGVAALVLGVRPMVVQSGSMSPAIPTGSLVLAMSVPADEVTEGDVVSVTDPRGTRITHRVVDARSVAGEAPGRVALTLQGDANPVPDAEPYLVASADRVIGDVPLAGYAVSWASGPLGTFLLGGIAMGLLASVLRDLLRREAGGGSQALVVGAVVLAVGGTWLMPSVRPTSTLAAFTDTSAAASTAATASVSAPTGAVGCANGPAFSNQVVLSWPAVPNQTTRSRYRVEIYAASGLSSNLLRRYDIAGTTLAVLHSDLDRDTFWSGTASVRVLGSVDGTSWQSLTDIRRTIYVGLTGSSYRCAF